MRVLYIMSVISYRVHCKSEKKAKKEAIEIPEEEEYSEDDDSEDEEDPFLSSDSDNEIKESGGSYWIRQYQLVPNGRR